MGIVLGALVIFSSAVVIVLLYKYRKLQFDNTTYRIMVGEAENKRRASVVNTQKKQTGILINKKKA